MTVRQKQLLLAWMGCLEPKDVDGIWGPQSAGATERMQKILGLYPDGVWGDQTDAAVREYIYSGTDIPEEPGQTVEPEPGITGDPELDEKLRQVFQGIRYLSPEEARCRCGGRYCNGFPAVPDRELLELADDLREKAGVPLHRSSFLRCPQHNANERGVKTSKHMSGKALDFFIEGISGQQLLAMAQADPRTSYAYIISGQYVHVDVN